MNRPSGSSLSSDPIEQLRLWIGEAVQTGLTEPTAMSLATAGSDGQPSVRLVILKALHSSGLLFATNFGSRKARELAANPRAAAVLYWDPLARQVRIEGRTERATPEESDKIFAARPRRSKLSAWASRQSETILDRDLLGDKIEALEGEFGRDVARPDFWGAYRLVPESIEFWIGRRDRLHDRFLYTMDPGGWKVRRLAP